jgi:hypothetical protein
VAWANGTAESGYDEKATGAASAKRAELACCRSSGESIRCLSPRPCTWSLNRGTITAAVAAAVFVLKIATWGRPALACGEDMLL